MADSKKLSFSTSPKGEQFPPKFHGLVLGLVGLIDAKGIDVAQPISEYDRSRIFDIRPKPKTLIQKIRP